jgi:biopolymer transport protein ExbD
MRALVIFGFSLLLVGIADARQTQPYLVCDAPQPRPPGYIDDSGLIQVRLTVKPNGSVLWNGALVSKQDFDSYIADAGRMEPRPLVIVTAEPETKYSTVVSILRRIRIAGVLRTVLDDVPAAVSGDTHE